MVNCHCSRCRRQTGAASGTFVFVTEVVFRWLTGHQSIIDCKIPEADIKGTAFCRHCGSRVPRLRDPGGTQMPAGSLDADPGAQPAMNIFIDSRAFPERARQEHPLLRQLPAVARPRQ